MAKTLPATDAKHDFNNLISNIQKKMDEYVITVNGKPVARLVSNEEYESLKETLEIMSNPQLMKDIKEGEEEIKRGEYVTLEEFEKELEKNV